MIQPWRLLTVAAVLSASVVGTATAQTVMARHVPAGERVEVMVNGKSGGSGTPDATGDAKVPFDLRGLAGKTEIDANFYVDRCDTTHRVWIVEVGSPIPSEGTCNLRSVSGLYWVRVVSTIVVNDVTSATPSLLLLKGTYTPPAPGQENVEAPPREFPSGLVLFGGGGFVKTNDVVATACGDVSDCSGGEGGIGFAAGGEYRIGRFVSAEVSYIKPPAVDVTGSETTFRFTSKQQANVFTVSGKIGAPIGIAKIYGRGGAIYSQAKVETSQTQDDRTVTVDGVAQTIPGGTQDIVLKTDGWGWLFGGGLELWVSKSWGFYGEFTYSALKGKDVDGGEFRLDNRLGAAIVGLRVHLGK